ncbi:hypothetical protein G7Z17_g3602 [Cylindrodendrum hubeiense]|uniref:Zn(2)-C6 fungal-type domain-containing protein n=1 Tax=Cylindrodendrum hubeiense TaxID=595255 RepID=A0A9P5HED7_9HYPO|nr:hypothetical protein G7Z17_g3602 [Cylindrodendrum hubeiense]
MATSSTSQPEKSEWLVYIPDFPDAAERRTAVFSQHIEKRKSDPSDFWVVGGGITPQQHFVDNFQLMPGILGATLEEPFSPGQSIKITGSAMIVFASTRETVLARLKDDPLSKGLSFGTTIEDNRMSTTVNPAPTRLSNAGRKRRSCVNCSKRKVKCDKQQPCTSCSKIGSECVFPHVSNRSELALTPELMAMLQRLERVVQTLEPRDQEMPGINFAQQCNPEYNGHQNSASGYAPEDAAAMGGVERSDQAIGAEPFEQSFSFEHSEPGLVVESENKCTIWPSVKVPSASLSHKESPGRIVRDHGRDTYVKRWFWDECSTETSSGFTMDDEDCEDIQHVQEHMPKTSTEFCAGNRENHDPQHSSFTLKEKTSHILFEQRLQLWSVYKERVEPLTKLFHLPSLEQDMMASRQQNSDNGMECVLLAISYGAVTSLTEEECLAIFQDGQAQVLPRIREDLERRLSGSMLVHTDDIRPLQALTLYLAFLRHHDPRLSWNLSGVAIRLAQNFGLHREDNLLKLTKFEMEMRRRLWWQIAILDAPSAEEYSGEYNLLEMGTFDTRLPQNLNDAQLDPGMMEYPLEKRGFTGMTFTLVRCEVTNMYRCIADSRKVCGRMGKSYADLTAVPPEFTFVECTSLGHHHTLTDALQQG